jgi:hypothetical protein
MMSWGKDVRVSQLREQYQKSSTLGGDIVTNSEKRENDSEISIVPPGIEVVPFRAELVVNFLFRVSLRSSFDCLLRR